MSLDITHLPYTPHKKSNCIPCKEISSFGCASMIMLALSIASFVIGLLALIGVLPSSLFTSTVQFGIGFMAIGGGGVVLVCGVLTIFFVYIIVVAVKKKHKLKKASHALST